MSREPLIGGGHLVQVHGGRGLAVEGVPGARRGAVVTSALRFLDGGQPRAGQYRLTVRAVAGSDLWRVVRYEAVS